MATPSLGDIKEIVNIAIDLYDKYKDALKQIKDLGSELNYLKSYLQGLDALLLKHKKTLESRAKTELRNLQTIIKDTRSLVDEVRNIFEKWDDKNLYRQLIFAWLSKNPQRLEDLGDDIKMSNRILDAWIQLMQLQLVAPDPNGSTTPRKQHVSPSPAPPAVRPRAKSILFVTNYDTSVGVIAAFYAQLLKKQCKQAGRPLPLWHLHSVGTKIAGYDAVATVQRALAIDTAQPGRHPNPTSIESLFDNPRFGHSHNAHLRKAAAANTARPLRPDYAKYDYIITFDDEARQLFKKIAANLEQSHGVKPHKGKMIRLASYHPQQSVKQIWSPRGQSNPLLRDQWNVTTAQVKLAFNQFLKQELGWQGT